MLKLEYGRHVAAMPASHTWYINIAGCENSTDLIKFTSDLLLQRRQTFHKNLLEKVKDYHEVRGS